MRLSEAVNLHLNHGTVERISFDGIIDVDSTVMVYIGEKKIIAKRALLLGIALVICHILDGVLTFYGMEIFGTDAEGNSFLRFFMEQYGHGVALFIGKSLAIVLTLALMAMSHYRLWLRKCIGVIIVFYLTMAVVPWLYIISSYFARG
ncbi:MAG: hypothetical protein KDD60_01685 [Bdellovibrionales bacterium]|nr:hypothetical protein [Bdellovibrionales bacterium]